MCTHTRFNPTGDRDLDALRQAALDTPADASNFAARLALATTWMHLLQRQGADLSEYIPAYDKLRLCVLEEQRPACFIAIDEALAALERCWLQLAAVPAELSSRCQIPEGGSVRVEPGPPAENWPVYGGNRHHTASTADPGPVEGRLAWKFPVGLAWYAHPVVENGRVYVPSPGMRRLLSCLDLETGACLWETRRPWSIETLANSRAGSSAYTTPTVASSPVLLESAIVLNELGAQSRAAGARSLTFVDKQTGQIVRRSPAGQADYRMGYAPLAGNAAYLLYLDGTQRIQDTPPHIIGPHRLVCKRSSDGETLWSFHIGPTFAAPILDGDQAIVGTADGMVFCLNLTGASPTQSFGFSDERRVAWSFKAGGAVNAPVEVDARHVYVGANDGSVVCLDRATGALIWKTAVARPDPRSFRFFSRPTLARGRLYLGASDRRLYCLDARDGRVCWSHLLPDWLRSRPVVWDDQVAAVAMDGTLICLRDAGPSATVLWQASVSTHPVYADLVLAAGRLLVTSSDLFMWCLDASDGALRWQHSLLDQATVGGCVLRSDEMGSGGWYQSKPTAADGLVYIGTPSHFVFALDYATGEECWRFELGAAVSGAPAYADGKVFVGQQGGEEYFYCLDAQTGIPRWRQALGWVWSSANVDQGRVLVPGVDGYLSCLDANSGHIIWRYRSARAAHPEPAIDQGRVFFGSWDHYVYAFDILTGTLLWQFHTGGSPDSGAPIACGGRLYVPMGGKRLCCLDAATGALVWEYRISEGCMNASPALWNRRLYISTSVRPAAIPIASRIHCVDAETGRDIWTHPGGGITGPAVAGGKVYFANTSDPYFYCVDAEGNGDGTTTCLWRCEMGERVYESVPAIYAGLAYILSESGYLYAFR